MLQDTRYLHEVTEVIAKSFGHITADLNFAPGEMAERSIAAVLKTVEVKASGGSNPSLSASLHY